MTQKLTGQTILIATHNAGKLEEFRELLAPFGVTVKSAGELKLAQPAETESTFRGNAHIKAKAACKASGMITIADDSGICVDALKGAPGVYTADWAGPARDWTLAMRMVESKLAAVGADTPAKRQAQFCCTLCVMWPGGEERYYEGIVAGQMVWPPRGKLGHGYDPTFMPDGAQMTFGEMPSETKNKISHRAKAVEKLLADLF